MRVLPVSPRAYRRLALSTIVLLVVLMVSGAVVRLSNSGLGCDTWPRCNQLHAIALNSNHERIEQINRLFSGLILVPIALLLVGAYRLGPRRRPFVAMGWTMLVLYLGNAVLGGIAVKVKLAWVSVMGHFLLALALLAVMLVNHSRARTLERECDPVTPDSSISAAARAMARAAWCGVLVAIVLGTLVTASGPHGGDAKAKRLAWSLENIARIHGITVDVVLALVVATIVVLHRQGAARTVVLSAGAVLVAMSVQATIGYVQWFRQIPAVLVGFHVFGATLVFVTVTELQLVIGRSRAA